MSKKQYFGTHIGSSYEIESLIESTKKVKEVGGNLVQIFLTMPGETKTSEKSKKDLLSYKKFLDENNMKVVVHSSYIHNMARDWDTYSWWIKNLELEIKYCHEIGAIGLVLHFGKKLELSTSEAYNNMYSSLIYIHNQTKEYKNIKIFLETPTGQGSEICYNIEDLAYFYNKFSKNVNKEIRNRFKICIDTCHVFSAGYDLRNKENIKRYLEKFEELIGIKNVYLIHLNDCKVNIGEKKDRHDNIGKGFIGLNGLQHVFNFFRKLNVPIILETPNEGYLSEIKLLIKNYNKKNI